jgi:two-component sensor histidine kinase
VGRWFDVYLFRTQELSPGSVAILFRDISERKAAEGMQKLLLDELNHRVKNTLVTVQSIANQTLLASASMEDFTEKFRGRVATLADSHDLLARGNWEGAELTDLLRKLVGIDGDSSRIALSGPAVLLRPQGALNLSLVIYELATNARKYGALSSPKGRVRVSWSVANRDGEGRLDLDWLERDGPAVTAPAKSGFGTTLIEHSLKGVGGEVVLQYDPGGLSCRILMPLASVSEGD